MAEKLPPFSAQFHASVGDGLTVVLACTGSTPAELKKHVGHLREIALEQRGKHNAAVLDAREEITRTQSELIASAVRGLCERSGLPVPDAYKLPNGHDAQEGGDYADPSGAVHAPADS